MARPLEKQSFDAWGDIDWTLGVGTSLALKKDFGVASVVPIGVGKFVVTIQSKDPVTGAAKNLTEASITVTISDDAVADEAKVPGYATASHIGVPGRTSSSCERITVRARPTSVHFFSK